MRIVTDKERGENIMLVGSLICKIQESRREAYDLCDLAMKVMLKLEVEAKSSDNTRLAELYGEASELYARAFQHDMAYLPMLADADKVKLMACRKGA